MEGAIVAACGDQSTPGSGVEVGGGTEWETKRINGGESLGPLT